MTYALRTYELTTPPNGPFKPILVVLNMFFQKIVSQNYLVNI